MEQKSSQSDTEVRLRSLYMEVKNGDQKAYREFLETCGLVTRRFLAFIDRAGTLKDQWDDLSQEVLSKIHLKKHTYREELPILPWIHSVIRYTYIDHYRKLKRTSEIEAIPEIREVEAPETEGIAEIFDLLTPDQRHLIQSISIEGKSFAELSKELSVREATLRVRYHRLINQLKARLDP